MKRNGVAWREIIGMVWRKRQAMQWRLCGLILSLIVALANLWGGWRKWPLNGWLRRCSQLSGWLYENRIEKRWRS